jgi:hypothetical protein
MLQTHNQSQAMLRSPAHDNTAGADLCRRVAATGQIKMQLRQAALIGVNFSPFGLG